MKYQVMPPLSKEEYEALKTDIAENGVQVPVEYDEDGNILDGYHRVQICKELGIEEFPYFVRRGMTEEEKIEHAYRLNYNRRHVTKEQKQKDAKKLRHQGWSYRRIAAVLGVSHPTVMEWLGEEGGRNLPPEPSTITGRDGKQYPAKKEKRPLPPMYGIKEEQKKVITTLLDKAEKGDKLAKKAADNIAKGELSITKAKVYLRRQEIKEKARPVEPPEGKYRIIYADPPWNYDDKRDGKTTGAEDHYPSMTIEELCNLPVKELAEENAVLFLWVTSPLLEECFKVINAWGFKYKTSFVWDKVKHNMGHYNSVRHEFLLVCIRGSCKPDNPKLYDSVQSIERTIHSKKPEEFRDIIDDLYIHGKRIELFARAGEVPAGWEVWGNEADIVNK